MTTPPGKPGILRRLARAAGWTVLILAVAAVARGWFAFHDRVPGYSLNLDVGTSDLPPQTLRAGFGRVSINPDLAKLGPIYVAGFGQNRIATRVNDDLSAIACVLDNGSVRLGVVALDAIGFFHDDVVRVRRMVPPEWKLDYVIICSTHNHSTPDLMGLWGPHPLRSGVNQVYKDQVKAGCISALSNAVATLQPAAVAFHEIKVPTENLVTDTRKPEVYDPDLRIMHLVSPQTRATIGSLVTWANHPETPWSKNTELTSDFCGFLRAALEHGLPAGSGPLTNALGGIHLYLNGAVGGLITTSPGVNVHDPLLNQDFQAPSHEKSRAVAHQLAVRLLPQLLDTNTAFADRLPLRIQARTIDLPLQNNIFLLAGYLGLLDRGYSGWKKLRSEVALISLGDASFACIPGEIYPEIVNGGIEKAPGGDFPIDPLEAPPIREMMPGKVKFVFGLANDEVGYIIPKSQWDHDPPYLYHAKNRPYGEINSVGPDTAHMIHSNLAELCRSSTNTVKRLTAR